MSSGISNTEYRKKEFPKRCIKKTKTEPIIQWSYNPRHDASAYLMSRRDIVDEASTEEMQYLKFIMNCNDGCAPIMGGLVKTFNVLKQVRFMFC